MFSVKDKNVIITGGNKNLGLGITKAFCENGANVVVIASSESVFDVAKDLASQGFRVSGLKADLSQKEQIEFAFNEALDLLDGKLDVLINNAGIIRRSPAEEFSSDDWEDVINVNLNAVFVMSQLAGKVMIAQGGGKIINTASMLSFFGGQTVLSYAASKGGVAQLTKALSNEWAGKGICVNAIAPGYMATDMTEALQNDEVRSKEILGRIPAGRWGKPEDMQGLTIFLASSASDYITGAVIPVDGGYLVK